MRVSSRDDTVGKGDKDCKEDMGRTARIWTTTDHLEEHQEHALKQPEDEELREHEK